MSSLNLTLNESNISVANNTSDVTVAVGVKFTDGWWAASDTGSSITVSCNGTSKTLSFGPYNIGANGSKNFGSIKFSGIKHSSDGSKSVTASATWVVPFGNGYKVSGSASKTLTKIARASSISSISGSTLGSAITVNINRLNSGFTHTITYKFGSITRSYTGQATACTFTPPLSDASQISQAVSGSATVSVQTYSGSTAIGSAVSKVFTLNLPSSVLPSITGPTITRVDNGVPAAWGVYVQGFSKANISIGGTGIYGSTIASYALSGGGYSSSNASLATGVLNTAGTNTFTGTIRDSRGRAVSKSASITVLEYSNPTAVITVERCNSNGTANTDGTYVKVIALFACASVSSKNNIVSKTITVGNYTSTSFTSGSPVVLGGALSTDSSYTATLTIKDALGSSTIAKTIVPTGAVTMDYKAGGNGVAFGKVAEVEDIVDSAWPIYVQGQRLANIAETCINRGVIPANANLNNYTVTGYYHQPLNDNASTGSNYPIGEAGLLLVYNADYIYQTYHHFYGEGKWSRTYYYGTWTSWKKDAVTTDSMHPLAHDHLNEPWIGSQQSSLSGWIGWYSSYHGVRKGWIGHNSGSDFHIVNEENGGLGLCTRGAYLWFEYSDSTSHAFRPAYAVRDIITLGYATHRWSTIYSKSGSISTSDRNNKHDIKELLNEKHRALFMGLKPVSFVLNNADSGRTHFGFISQDVEEKLIELGMNGLDFAGFCKDQAVNVIIKDNGKELVSKKFDDNGNPIYEYSLRYEEFISLNTMMIQDTIRHLSLIESKLNHLEDTYTKYLQDYKNEINIKLQKLENKIRLLEDHIK